MSELKRLLEEIQVLPYEGDFGPLTKSQIFMSGQINVLMRLLQKLEELNKQPSRKKQMPNAGS